MADDLGKIEVQLSMLSAQESAAFREIQQTAKAATEMMQMFKSRDFVEAAERLAKVHKQMVESTAQMSQVSQQLQDAERQQGVRGRIGGAVQRLGERFGGGSGQAKQSDEQKAHEKLADDAKVRQKDQDERRDRERDRRLESMTDVERSAEHRRQRAGLPSTWEDPDLQGPDPQQAYNRISTLNPNLGGIQIPRFGELTIQDLLGQLRNMAVTTAGTAGAGTPGFNTNMARAARLDFMSRGAGNVAAVGAGMRMARRYIVAPLAGATARFDETIPMGYGRDTNPFSDILGFQTPFSAYGEQSAREMWDQWHMRWSGGINKEQAAEINTAANRAGFAGPQGTQVRMDLMAPAFRDYKIDPNNIIPFTQTLRTGTANIQQLNQVIMQLGEGARAARMDVNSYTQAIAQSGEAAQQGGGQFLQGVTFGNQFSQSFGLDPSVGNTLLQNPVVQGFISARTGLPPNLAGAASPLAQQRALETALISRVQAYSGTMPSHREAIKDVNGRVIGYETTSGQDAAIGAAAQSLGIDQEQAKAILNRQGSQGVENFAAASRDYYRRATVGRQDPKQIVADMQKKGRDEIIAHGTTHTNPDLKYDAQTGEVLRKGAGWLGIGWGEDKELTQQLHDRQFGAAAQAQQRNAPGTDLRELHQMAMAAGVSQSDWHSQVDNQRDIYKRVQNAQKLVEQKSIEANADPNAVKFTGPAAKFFEALVKSNKNLAGASDLSKAVIATSSAGSSPLSTQSNSSGVLFP